MSSLALPKHYTDRAVQTDLTITSPSASGFTIDISDTSTYFLPALESVSPPETEAPMDIPAKSSAYMQSEHLPLEDPVESLPARKDRKVVSLASGLGYPSTRVTTTQRVMSLPEHPASGAARLALVEKHTRIVSMPERGKLSNLVSVSEHVETNANLVAGGMARSYPSDIPQTPSPPSSPESVMIIGNEGRVSGSFLQGHRRSFTDDDGWVVTWANSPPRPIPALHGPLSLPYARCPSGAEGTVVEGDDLSNKVWGLGADDTPAHTRYHRSSSHVASQPAQANQSPEIKAHTFRDQYQASSHQRRRDTVIDLSQPSTFDHNQDVTLQHPRNSGNAVTQGSAAKDSNDLADLATSAMAMAKSAMPYIHIRQQDLRNAPRKTYGAETATGDQLGLALQWESLFNSDPQAKAWTDRPKSLGTGQGCSNNRLNTSAPPFVPQSYVSPSLLDKAILQEKLQYSRTEQAQRAGYHASDTLATTPTAQDHNVQSPPSTASPLWTPIFTQAAGMYHGHGKQFLSRASQQMPDVYSPELDRGGYKFDRLASMHMISQFQDYDLQGLNHSSLNKDKYSQMSVGNGYSGQELNQHRGRSPVLDIHQQQFPVLFDASNQHQHNNSNNLTAAAVDRRRSLTQQHPRSIPLARLIQRRLSSVVEEEVLNSGNYGAENAASSSSGFLRQLPSEAPVRQLPVSPETLRAAHSSGMFAQRSRPKISAYADEVQPVFGPVNVPENPSTMAMMMGSVGGGGGGGGGGRLQQLNVQNDPKAVVKLPGPRVDARSTVSNRHTAGHAAATRPGEHAHMKPHSREDTTNAEEKENVNANEIAESATANPTSSGRMPKKNYNKHKKRSERAAAASVKVDRSS